MKPFYEIDEVGTIKTRDVQGQLHSFNGKPAAIKSDGSMYWFNHGLVTKHTNPSGGVLFCLETDTNIEMCFQSTFKTPNGTVTVYDKCDDC